MARGTHILLGILGILVAGFIASVMVFVEETMWRGTEEYQSTQELPVYPLAPPHASAGPVIFTSIAIPVTVGILTRWVLSSHKRGNILAGLAAASGIVAFFFIDLLIVLHLLT